MKLKVLLIYSSIFLFLGFNFIQIKEGNNLINKFEKKIKIDTTKTVYFKKLKKCFIENGDYKGKINSKSYFMFTNNGNQNVGTDIKYSSKGQITELGTWQTKTDSFMLSNTDTLIIFSNPYKKQYCRIEYDTTIKAGAFLVGYVTGYAFEWTETNKLKSETIIHKDKNTFVIKRDTINGKIISKKKL